MRDPYLNIFSVCCEERLAGLSEDKAEAIREIIRKKRLERLSKVANAEAARHTHQQELFKSVKKLKEKAQKQRTLQAILAEAYAVARTPCPEFDEATEELERQLALEESSLWGLRFIINFTLDTLALIPALNPIVKDLREVLSGDNFTKIDELMNSLAGVNNGAPTDE